MAQAYRPAHCIRTIAALESVALQIDAHSRQETMGLLEHLTEEAWAASWASSSLLRIFDAAKERAALLQHMLGAH